jgi:hypothetical protein
VYRLNILKYLEKDVFASLLFLPVLWFATRSSEDLATDSLLVRLYVTIAVFRLIFRMYCAVAKSTTEFNIRMTCRAEVRTRGLYIRLSSHLRLIILYPIDRTLIESLYNTLHTLSVEQLHRLRCYQDYVPHRPPTVAHLSRTRARVHHWAQRCFIVHFSHQYRLRVDSHTSSTFHTVHY